MFTIENKTDNSVLITSNRVDLIFSTNSFKRAQGRKARKADIRKPVKIEINGSPFIFTRKEWATAKKEALNYKKRHADIPQVRRQEIQDKGQDVQETVQAKGSEAQTGGRCRRDQELSP